MTDPIEVIIGDYRAFAAQQRDRLATRGIDITPCSSAAPIAAATSTAAAATRAEHVHAHRAGAVTHVCRFLALASLALSSPWSYPISADGVRWRSGGMRVWMILELSRRIGRPPAEVFHFVAIDHVRNHPRWDPLMELEQVSPGPIGVGTVIQRRHTHTGSPVEGTMEVTEFERDRLIGFTIKDGAVEMRTRMIFEPDGDGTIVSGSIEVPGMRESMDPAPIEASLNKMKQLIESGDDSTA